MSLAHDGTILLTGVAGFIGYHLAERLLREGCRVVGVDSLNDYYDPRLKRARLERLLGPRRASPSSSSTSPTARPPRRCSPRPGRRRWCISPPRRACATRWRIRTPMPTPTWSGFLNVLEGCRHHEVAHLVYASTSSVYGANTKMPFSVHDNVDHPVSLYAATKKANELMAHTYSHLYRLPVTGLRFFTVYGPWGRPGHGAVPVHQGHARRPADPGVQPGPDAARLHLCRRHRRGRAPGDRLRARARSGLVRRAARSRHQPGTLPDLQYRQPPGRSSCCT